MAITVSGTPVENIAAADPQSFTCTGSSTPKGACVLIAHGTTSNDIVNGVTYGGVAMTRIRSDVDTTTEAGRSYIYFLGSGVPTGSQTVSIDRTEGTTNVHATAFTLDATKDLQSVDNDGLSDNVANPSVTLQYGGRTCLALSVLYTGAASPPAAGANCTIIHTHDFTAFGSAAQQQTTEGSADFAIGHTLAIDDVAFSAFAVSEVVPPPPFLTRPWRTRGRRTGAQAKPRRR